MDNETRLFIREIVKDVTGSINHLTVAMREIAQAQASQAAVAEATLTPDQRSLIPNRHGRRSRQTQWQRMHDRLRTSGPNVKRVTG
jgi:hypothetical protein